MSTLGYQHIKTISAVAQSARVGGYEKNSSQYGVTFRDAFQQLIDEAKELDAYCMPMMCRYILIGDDGRIVSRPHPEQIGKDIESSFMTEEISPSLGEPHTITRDVWRLVIDPDKLIPIQLKSRVRQIKIFGSPVVDIDKLPESTTSYPGRDGDKNIYSIEFSSIPGKELLLKTIDISDPQSLDAKLNRPSTVESDIKTLTLSESADQSSVAKDNEVAHLESSEARNLTDDTVHSELSATESQCLSSCRNIMDCIRSADLATIAQAISRVTDEKTLRDICQCLSEALRYKNADSADTVVIPPGKLLGNMCAETGNLDSRIYSGNPLPLCVGHEPGLPVPLLGRIRKMSQLLTAYKKSLHSSSVTS
ncbi:MAG: hypothetical protein K2K94_04645 [Muribaculaceae bacterium]|nr:hypothetical protein [Muribaculaceae bacterium]